MVLGLLIVFATLAIILLGVALVTYEDSVMGLSVLFWILTFIIIVIGSFTGFVNYPPTEGTHQGEIIAIDLEGAYFRRYEIYLKSNGFTSNSDGNISNETKYLIYEHETELAEQLKNAIGKTVKLNYGHDGGYITWKSCGTYHIKSIEILED